MTAETSTSIPEEWSDPRHVIPHLTHELRDWLLDVTAIAHDLAVIQGGLDPNGTEVSPAQVLEWVTATRARLDELAHSLGGRVQAFVLISEELKRNGGTPHEHQPPRETEAEFRARLAQSEREAGVRANDMTWEGD